jgi:hypothetical protein
MLTGIVLLAIGVAVGVKLKGMVTDGPVGGATSLIKKLFAKA